MSATKRTYFIRRVRMLEMEALEVTGFRLSEDEDGASIYVEHCKQMHGDMTSARYYTEQIEKQEAENG